MITNNSREEGGLRAKEEEQKNEGRITPRVASSSSRQWSSFRNPRIVRVSRSFGGKDRHSKVCTVRGLRDRRIRLSVPTAIQLYDLQDKLGLSQPSKVIDWLLDATKQDIDKLPPLQMPQGFGQFHQQMFGPSGSRNLIGDLLLSHESSTSQSSLSPFFPTSANSTFLSKHGIRINDNADAEDQNDDETLMAKSSKYWDMDSGLRTKSKEILQKEALDEKGKSIETNELQRHGGVHSQYAQVSAQNFFPIVGYSSLPAGLPNNTMPYSYNQWEPSNLSLSQFGSQGFQPQTENLFYSNSMGLPSSSSALPSGSQLYFCSPTMPSLFPSYPSYLQPTNESDSRQMSNHLQLLNAGSSQHILPTSLMSGLRLISPSMRSFQTNANSKFLHPQENHQSQEDEDADDS